MSQPPEKVGSAYKKEDLNELEQFHTIEWPKNILSIKNAYLTVAKVHDWWYQIRFTDLRKVGTERHMKNKISGNKNVYIVF